MRLDLLHILWEFLTTEKIPNRKWDFETVNGQGNHKKFSCESAGCVLGELPVIWSEFRYSKNNGEIYYESQAGFDAVRIFFGLNHNESQHLFDFGLTTPVYKNSNSLMGSATREDVAANLKEFIIKASNKELYSQVLSR